MEHRIRERAYKIWATSGRKHGNAEQHWLAAEREFLSEYEITNPAREKKPIGVRGERRPPANIRPTKVANSRWSG